MHVERFHSFFGATSLLLAASCAEVLGLDGFDQLAEGAACGQAVGDWDCAPGLRCDDVSRVCVSGSGGNGGTGGMAPSGCNPSDADWTPQSACGVFISEAGDDDSGLGTPESPFRSFSRAALESAKAIYACAGQYSGDVTLVGDRTVYAGMTCTMGAWSAGSDAARSTIVGAQDSPEATVTLGGAGAFTIDRLEVLSSGGLGVFVGEGATLILSRSGIEVADQPDAPPPQPLPVDPSLDGTQGAPGGNSQCAGGNGVAGVGELKLCFDPDTNSMVATNGGDGGVGVASAGNGLNGQSGLPVTLGGDPGAGEGVAGMCDGGAGGDGQDGANGSSAMGAGTIGPAGFSPPVAGPGLPGHPGGGGGGGGGGKACSVNQKGPGGGGGGAGGCGGGMVGAAGVPGRSAIALVAYSATLQLSSVDLVAGRAGNGQNGQDGQAGGYSGSGGFGPGFACNGGQGGDGGRAGGGGGGAGGHSIALARFGGAAPVFLDVTATIGSPGVGGDAGNNLPEKGAAGVAGEQCTIDGSIADCMVIP